MEMRSFGKDDEGASLVGKNRFAEPPSTPTPPPPPRQRLPCRHAVAGRTWGGVGWTLVWLVVLAIGVSETRRNLARRRRFIQVGRVLCLSGAPGGRGARAALCVFFLRLAPTAQTN